MNTHQYIATIAGFDPSSGAGLSSDIKSFEAHGFYGLSVCTAITVQNDITFKDCIWTVPEVILAQIETLFERFNIPVIKIGIVQSWEVLRAIVHKIKTIAPETKIIVDPIVKASAGFDFHSKESQELLDGIWKQCYIITPNYEEIQQLYPSLSIEETLDHLSTLTQVYLKGGHREDKKGWDTLYHSHIIQVNLAPTFTKNMYEKHGSGCVLSAALACQIYNDQSLEDACKKAKYYTELFLRSDPSLLGKHDYAFTKEINLT